MDGEVELSHEDLMRELIFKKKQLQINQAQLKEVKKKLKPVNFMAKRDHLKRYVVGILIKECLVWRGVWVYMVRAWKTESAHLTEDELEDVAFYIYTHTSRETRTAWRYPRNESEVWARNLALQHHCEYSLCRWVLYMNHVKGIAPPSELMFEKYAELWPWAGRAGIQNRPLELLGRSVFARRMWMVRFRRRWGLNMGSLKIEADLTAEEVRRKATILEVQKPIFHECRNPFRARELEPKTVPKIGAPYCNLIRGYPKWGTEMGSNFWAENGPKVGDRGQKMGVPGDHLFPVVQPGGAAGDRERQRADPHKYGRIAYS